MPIEEKKKAGIEAGRDVLMKYCLPDALKPQYDGMTGWELVKKIIEAYEAELEK